MNSLKEFINSFYFKTIFSNHIKFYEKNIDNYIRSIIIYKLYTNNMDLTNVTDDMELKLNGENK